MSEVPILYTTREAQELLKVSQRTLYRYLKSGELKGVKIAGGKWRIPESSVVAFLGLNKTNETN